ncbi:MAG: coproporphyrinogen III oxidase family protein, partial [Clostridia bacterium]|nr:coproporphyrinogen III oxidase family protein [Clostridia bacterium]
RREGHFTADTLYFGGGTPSRLGGRRLAAITREAARLFGLTDAEITMEANPADDLAETFAAFAAEGGNRVSIGLQTADDEALLRLGRRHTVSQVERAVQAAHRAGITNLSLDLMLGLEGQTAAQVRRSVAACADMGATHVSAYLLKVEPNTPFARRELHLPDEEATADLYEIACDALNEQGYRQYEISNFAKDGRVSRHNLKYWNCDPTVGIGPAAHSFFGGTRLSMPRDLTAFLQGRQPSPEPADDAIGDNTLTEYAMLRLRLTEGLTEAGCRDRFGVPLPAEWRRRAERLPRTAVLCDETGIRLTRQGFLLSNALLAAIL